MMSKIKSERVLELFFRAMRGESLSVRQLADQYHVSTRSISRDIAELKAFLAEHRELVGNAELQYSTKDHCYQLNLDDFISSKELFAIELTAHDITLRLPQLAFLVVDRIVGR